MLKNLTVISNINVGVQEGWDSVKQDTVNGWIDNIPQYFKEYLELEGAITGHENAITVIKIECVLLVVWMIEI